MPDCITIEVSESPIEVSLAEQYTITVDGLSTFEVETGDCCTEITVLENLVTETITVQEITVEVDDEATTVVEVGIPGLQGPQGPPGTGSGRVEVRFDWGDATPKNLTTVPAGKLVEKVWLYITVPFNGTNPALTVGDSGDTDRLMAAHENDPTTEAAYEATPIHEYGSNTVVTLSITPGAGATAGSGLAIIQYED